MKQIDPVLDSEPTEQNINTFIQAEIRNNICFTELRHYEQHEQFLAIHPFTKEYSNECRLERLLRNDADAFMQEMINANKGITRYRSLINNNKHKDDEQLRDWEDLIADFKSKLEIMKRLISVKN